MNTRKFTREFTRAHQAAMVHRAGYFGQRRANVKIAIPAAVLIGIWIVISKAYPVIEFHLTMR